MVLSPDENSPTWVKVDRRAGRSTTIVQLKWRSHVCRTSRTNGVLYLWHPSCTERSARVRLHLDVHNRGPGAGWATCNATWVVVPVCCACTPCVTRCPKHAVAAGRRGIDLVWCESEVQLTDPSCATPTVVWNRWYQAQTRIPRLG